MINVATPSLASYHAYIACVIILVMKYFDRDMHMAS